MSAKNQRLDRDSIHSLLREQADARGHVFVQRGALAEQLDVTVDTISRLMAEFVNDGRIQQVTRKKTGIVYQVRPVSEFTSTVPPEPERPTAPSWG